MADKTLSTDVVAIGNVNTSVIRRSPMERSNVVSSEPT
jgi:hypothetical protein